MREIIDFEKKLAKVSIVFYVVTALWLQGNHEQILENPRNKAIVRIYHFSFMVLVYHLSWG